MPPQANRLINNGPVSVFANSGVSEKVTYPFYDRKSFVTATAQTNTYFTTPGTDDLVSNFEGTGAFPAGQGYFATGLRIVPDVQADEADVAAFLKASSLIFTIENGKRYAMGPSWLFPGGVGAVSNFSQGVAAVATGSPANSKSFGGNGIASLNNLWRFKLPVILRPQQQFKIAITTPATLTLSATLPVYVVLEGTLERNLQ